MRRVERASKRCRHACRGRRGCCPGVVLRVVNVDGWSAGVPITCDQDVLAADWVGNEIARKAATIIETDTWGYRSKKGDGAGRIDLPKLARSRTAINRYMQHRIVGNERPR